MDWKTTIGAEKEKPYFTDLQKHISDLREAGKVVYPPKSHVFQAFKLTAFDQIKVVIIGQDPYHGPNQAHGLCFL